MSGEPLDLPERRAGRVLLVDAAGRLLLFQTCETLPQGGERILWYSPGGGAEAGESFAATAARELFEETGLRVTPAQLGPAVALRGGVLPFQGVIHRADEVFFYLPVDAWDVDISRFTDGENEFVLGYRWWTVAEFEATDEIVFPEPHELAMLLRELTEQGRPRCPRELSW